jgi:Asp-tRNA(Asn)/Glu-tRNA(Gln) amidotransferase C subunit
MRKKIEQLVREEAGIKDGVMLGHAFSIDVIGSHVEVIVRLKFNEATEETIAKIPDIEDSIDKIDAELEKEVSPTEDQKNGLKNFRKAMKSKRKYTYKKADEFPETVSEFKKVNKHDVSPDALKRMKKRLYQWNVFEKLDENQQAAFQALSKQDIRTMTEPQKHQLKDLFIEIQEKVGGK